MVLSLIRWSNLISVPFQSWCRNISQAQRSLEPFGIAQYHGVPRQDALYQSLCLSHVDAERLDSFYNDEMTLCNDAMGAFLKGVMRRHVVKCYSGSGQVGLRVKCSKFCGEILFAGASSADQFNVIFVFNPPRTILSSRCFMAIDCHRVRGGQDVKQLHAAAVK